MPRAPFQVLVIPWYLTASGLRYAVLRRSDLDIWQFIAGGGEEGETPEEAARREAFEEGGVPLDSPLLRLDSVASIPAIHFPELQRSGTDRYVISEYTFGVEVGGSELLLSEEHAEYQWLAFQEARERLRFDSNRTALWELNERLLKS